ncbi:MAG: hypothetical protein M3275_16170, partial [Thermoproteota archaeon]|nr:hypothetical protein [Thermoproteota archaeon]
ELLIARGRIGLPALVISRPTHYYVHLERRPLCHIRATVSFKFLLLYVNYTIKSLFSTIYDS